MRLFSSDCAITLMLMHDYSRTPNSFKTYHDFNQYCQKAVKTLMAQAIDAEKAGDLKQASDLLDNAAAIEEVGNYWVK